MDIPIPIPESGEGMVKRGDGSPPQKMHDLSSGFQNATILPPELDDFSLTDTLFVERLKKYDQDAWYKFMRHCHGKIYNYIRSLGHDKDTSEDLTQQTFTNALDSIGALRDTGAFYGWIYRIATNLSNREYEKKKHVSIAIANYDRPHPDNGVLSRLEGQENLQKLYQAINQLKPKEREAIILHDLQQLSISDSATAAGVPEGTFKSRWHEARVNLKDILSAG